MSSFLGHCRLYGDGTGLKKGTIQAKGYMDHIHIEREGERGVCRGAEEHGNLRVIWVELQNRTYRHYYFGSIHFRALR